MATKNLQKNADTSSEKHARHREGCTGKGLAFATGLLMDSDMRAKPLKLLEEDVGRVLEDAGRPAP